eukprot:gene12300-biopygen19940
MSVRRASFKPLLAVEREGERVAAGACRTLRHNACGARGPYVSDPGKGGASGLAAESQTRVDLPGGSEITRSWAVHPIFKKNDLYRRPRSASDGDNVREEGGTYSPSSLYPSDGLQFQSIAQQPRHHAAYLILHSLGRQWHPTHKVRTFHAKDGWYPGSSRPDRKLPGSDTRGQPRPPADLQRDVERRPCSPLPHLRQPEARSVARDTPSPPSPLSSGGGGAACPGPGPEGCGTPWECTCQRNGGPRSCQLRARSSALSAPRWVRRLT